MKKGLYMVVAHKNMPTCRRRWKGKGLSVLTFMYVYVRTERIVFEGRRLGEGLCAWWKAWVQEVQVG
jgi:hypothetical protein